jgi:hypothetical protein
MLRRIAPLFILLVLAACSDRSTPDATGPSTPELLVSICHGSGATAQLMDVSRAELAAHLVHGDYIAGLEVDPSSTALRDGVHFSRITDALAMASAERVARREIESSGCRITIAVAAGIYRGSFSLLADPALERLPLVIEVPNVTLRGTFQMTLDAGGRATGVGASTSATILLPTPALKSGSSGSEPLLIVNGHPGGGYQGHGATIEGFVFQSGHLGNDAVLGGVAILTLRVKDLMIRANRFDSAFSESVDLRASSAVIERNHMSGGGNTCDICLAGPGEYRVYGNRLLAGGIPGVLVVPATLLPVPVGMEQYALPAASTVKAMIVNNEIRDHLRLPVGVGIRVGTVGIGAPNVAGTSLVDLRDNTISNNNFGVMVEAAFPVAGSTLQGNAIVTLAGNDIFRSCQNDVLVAFTRHVKALGAGMPQLPYLRNSSYTINLADDVDWSDVWYDNPAGMGNTLTVDGVVIPSGRHQAYDATKVCAP